MGVRDGSLPDQLRSGSAGARSVLGVRLVLPRVEGVIAAVRTFRNLVALGDVHALMAAVAPEIAGLPGILACVRSHLSIPPPLDFVCALRSANLAAPIPRLNVRGQV